MNKKILFIFIGLFILLSSWGIYLYLNPQNDGTQSPSSPSSSAKVDQNDPPQIVSTKPEPLDNNIVAATDIVEITFNRSLENVGEFKSKLEPEIKYKVELSADRKTAKIIPAKPYELGTTYTLFIGTETKFDGVGRWGQEKIFHFRTIKYSGV
ncbi:Ig-like domain-containing protein [Candidatus Daviesbacteria bacterium]|nr:Ig-like domain-containing protein [Candidatus Daviesbacteria bacterium]